ncbi:uncharacterized protein LOC132199373 [Neocloeon triangulifer]|uniref:uncharacterized protein LOC132199373 n=1 Tax=Neocloeon triangulifer TaxID=2078957 RepID=UPI00286F0BBE|nr:uncharacterized protein LOC132199373 [Neocloeon triangulifer]
MAKLQIALLVLACVASAALAQQQRRVVRVRQRVLAQPQEEQPVAEARADAQLSYYHVVPTQESQEYDEEPQQRPLQRQQVIRPRVEAQQRAIQSPSPRSKDATRAPPVETIRNFNTINDDGSFTFGYEAADGSFKEETRGTDCVVRGKYGYIDPDGNKREFTYVSGNPCDPNNPDPEEDDRSEEEDDSEENVPVRRPVAVRPNVSRVRPAAPAPSSVFQNEYQPRRVVTPAPVQSVTVVTPRPVARQQTFVQQTAAPVQVTTFRPELQSNPPATQATFIRSRPQPLVPANAPGAINFDEELKRFQIKQAAPATATVTPRLVAPTTQQFTNQQFVSPSSTASPARAAGPTVNPYYNSQLIFNPSTGQYNTVLYQQLPKGAGEFSLNTRLQPYVHQQQPQQQPFFPSQPFPGFQALRAGPTPSAPVQAAPQPQARYPANVVGAPHAPQQSFYYINPNLRNQFSTGQIDSFLKGHNLQL